jgi:hypothetical protein
MWRDGADYDPRELARKGARGLRQAAREMEQQADALVNPKPSSIAARQRRTSGATAATPNT